jgi:hypothetical protein
MIFHGMVPCAFLAYPNLNKEKSITTLAHILSESSNIFAFAKKAIPHYNMNEKGHPIINIKVEKKSTMLFCLYSQIGYNSTTLTKNTCKS